MDSFRFVSVNASAAQQCAAPECWFKRWHRSLLYLSNFSLHSQVVNLYEKLLSTYQDYQNDAVKHNEAFSLDEVEFMIYLTGNFMRLILQLARQVNNVTE